MVSELTPRKIGPDHRTIGAGMGYIVWKNEKTGEIVFSQRVAYPYGSLHTITQPSAEVQRELLTSFAAIKMELDS